MKKMGVFLLLMVFCFGSVEAQEIEPLDWRNNSQNKELKELIQSRKFLFKAEFAYKSSGQKVFLTNGYDLRMDSQFAACWLPSLDIVTGFTSDEEVEALQFREQIEDVDVQFDRRTNNYFINFVAYPSGNHMQFKMQVFDDGKARLVVYFDNRESIQFDGFVAKQRIRRNSI